MNLIAWNCNMAFRKKWPHLASIPTDIMVISECEHPTKFKPSQEIEGANDFVWIGNNEHKGLGVISFNGFQINVCSFYTEKFEYVLPVEVSNKTDTYLLFAIWAMPFKNSTVKSYVGQVWNAINHYADHLDERSMLIGDFNSNAIWDDMRKVGNHSQVVQFLAERNIGSLYHQATQEVSGSESQATLFLQKKKEKPYHIDYCFAAQGLLRADTTIKVGEYENWIEWSDHMPVMVEKLG